MMLFFLAAVVLMLVGYLFKVNRWAQFIKIYEAPDSANLCVSIALGHALNLLIPLRVGDVLRIAISGRRMRNGYKFAVSTVVVDLFLDTITVGLLFFLTSAIIGSPELIRASRFYLFAFLLLVVAAILVFTGNWWKIAIAKVCSLFNSRIELTLLYTSWAIISSFKDIGRKINKPRLLVNTLGMWAAYLLSYACFANAVTRAGTNMAWTDIFTILFTNRCFSVIFLSGGSLEPLIPKLLLIYMMSSPLIILALSFLYRRIQKTRPNPAGQSEPGFQRLLPQLKDSDRYAFLHAYFANENPEQLKKYLAINSDACVIQDLSAGSRAITLLCLKDDVTFYRKYAFGADGRKLARQLDWLTSHQGVLPLPRIIAQTCSDDYCCYDMSYDKNAVEMFQYLHSVPVEQGWATLTRILGDLDGTLHQIDRRPAQRAQIDEYIREKVGGNLERIRNAKGVIRQLQRYETIVINGMEYPNLPALEAYLRPERLARIFEADSYSDIHGDLTLENIICNSAQGGDWEYYIIDPNPGNLHDSPFLDYAKLLQSIHGNYEFLMKTPYVYIEGNRIHYEDTASSVYSALLQRFREYLANRFTRGECRSIFYHELIHWLRLLPYRIEKDGNRAALFYAGMLKVFNDIVRWYEEGEA